MTAAAPGFIARLLKPLYTGEQRPLSGQTLGASAGVGYPVACLAPALQENSIVPMYISENGGAGSGRARAASLSRRNQLYADHRDELEMCYPGQYVTFELESGKYVVAPTISEAINAAEREFESIDTCWTIQIGAL